MTVAISSSQNGFSVSGVVTFDNVVATSRQGEALIRTASGENQGIDIDLTNMREQNASALALLLTWLRTANKIGVTISFKNLSVSLQRMVAAFGLDDLIQN